jgi:hypothetical protein
MGPTIEMVVPRDKTNRMTPGRYPRFSQQRMLMGKVTAEDAEPKAVATARPTPCICGNGL